MKFDKSKILTSVTADQANGGDWGWFGDSINGIRTRVERGKEPKGLTEVLPDNHVHRFSDGPEDYLLFYPATYEFLQEQWVKENRLQIGDTVRVAKGWGYGDLGFLKEFKDHYLSAIGKVVGINDDNINIQAEWAQAGRFNALVPFFAIEIVKEPKPEYRPFANAEEFALYRDEWWRHKDGGKIFNVRDYGRFGVSENAYDEYTYEEFFESFVFADTGEPAGVKV